MNDFHMNSLAADRINGLRRDAQHARLVHASDPQQDRLPDQLRRRPRLLGLSGLLRRAGA